MRTMLKVSIPVEQGNKAIADGSLGKIIQATLQRTKAEAAYFTTENGNRTVFIFFDMKDLSDLPAIAEPLFHGFHAGVTFNPVMNGDDLQKGLAAWGKEQ
ncbi:MAG: hypothetical protein EPO28_11430 [Saprospiraceae bacterium]|nr:MAG: hypothetical protein EPO28_11430 [Saprospiraceae bacterium]